MKIRWTQLAVCLSLCLMLFTSGCIEPAMMFRGNLLNAVQVVSAIDGGVAHRDTLTSFEVVINYDYLRTGDTLAISGQGALTERYPGLYSMLRYLDIYLFFVDQDKRVLETVLLAKAMSRVDEVATFNRQLRVPDGAVGVSFGYSGEVLGGADGENGGGGGGEIFYLLPLTR